MKKSFDQFVNSESGATLVEYGIALLVAIVVGGTALTTLGAETLGNIQGANQLVGFDACDGTDCDTGGAQ